MAVHLTLSRLLSCSLVIAALLIPLQAAQAQTATSAPPAIRVNAAGGAFTDSAGHPWSADRDFIGGSTSSTTTAIRDTADQAIYQTARYGAMTYTFPVPDGDYTVTLQFAEFYWSHAGQRIFNVAINRQPVLTNFDIMQHVGSVMALDESFPVNVTDGSIAIAFSAVVDQPNINGIEIVPALPPASAPAPASVAPAYVFGTLISDRTKSVQEAQAGVGAAELEVWWNQFEPLPGVFNPAYAAYLQSELHAYQAAGLRVVLGAGLQYPPAWVLALPNSRYVDQHGQVDPGGWLNLTFNQPVRDQVVTYLAQLNAVLGFGQFWAVRIGSGGSVEALYPSEGTRNSYWAYDANAQGGADRPPTVPASPYPGWQPGQTRYQGQPFTPAQVQQWYAWYLGALVDGLRWQIAAYQRFGFHGDDQVLMPGFGTPPDQYRASIDNYLNGQGDAYQVMGRGAVWNLVLAGLRGQGQVVAYESNLGDGFHGNSLCQPGDQAVALDDPQLDGWSAIRWLSANARREGLAVMGENAGPGASGYGVPLLEAASAQMQACGLQGMFWALDANLYQPGSGVTLNNYSSAIHAYNH